MAGPLQRAELVLEADVDNDGTVETGTFVFVGDLEMTTTQRTGYLVGGRGSTANAVIIGAIERGDLSGQTQRAGIHIDGGGGSKAIDIQFTGWEGAKLEDGSAAQWGNTDAVKRTQASATGQDPLTQIDVLNRYLDVGRRGSTNPATLRYGEHHPDGLYSAYNVVIEGPKETRTADNDSVFTGSMTLIPTIDLREYIDAAQRVAWA